MADLTPDQLARLQALADQDPRAQAARLRYGRSRVSALNLKDVIGMDVPGYAYEPRTGKVTKITNFPKESLIGMSLVTLGPLALGGAAGAAPTAAAGGGSAATSPAAASSLAVPELGVDAIPSVLGGAEDVVGGGGSWWRQALRWLPDIGGKALDAYSSSRDRNARSEAERTRQAVTESQLDPFRGYMDQARDVSQLSWLADQDTTPTPTQVDPKYGSGLELPAPRDYGPSAETRAFLRAAAGRVAAGDSAPSITPGTQPLPVVKRKRNPNPDDPNSWLYE